MVKNIFFFLILSLCFACQQDNPMDTLPITIDSRKGISETSLNENYSLYPNPCKDYLYFELPFKESAEIRLAGKNGQQYQLNSKSPENITLNLSGCSDKILWCEIRLDNKVYHEIITRN
jgi:hypothetical protein